MGLGTSVHDKHVVNTGSTILTEVTDQEVSLLFCGLWRRRAVLVGCSYGPGWFFLWPLHCTTCEDEWFVLHMRGGEFLADQVCDPVSELVMTFRDKAAPHTIKGVAD